MDHEFGQYLGSQNLEAEISNLSGAHCLLWMVVLTCHDMGQTHPERLGERH